MSEITPLLTVSITLLGTLFGFIALCIGFSNLKPLRKLSAEQGVSDLAYLRNISYRLQISMVCGAIAGASQIWQNNIGTTLIWIGFFLIQFRNWQLLEQKAQNRQ